MVIEIANEVLKVRLAAAGAEIRAVKQQQTGVDYMWTGDEAYWGRVSPVLFPIVGRLKGDTYEVNGEAYPMSQHGFLRDVTFDLARKTATSASFVYESAGRHLAVYPYDFKVVIHYELAGDELKIGWEVVNLTDRTMYFSIGAHPAFNVPLQAGETLADYHLRFTPTAGKTVTTYSVQDALVREAGSVDQLENLPLEASLFKHDALIYKHIDAVTIVSNQSGHEINVTFPGFPYVGIWSPYSAETGEIAPFICIEPWHGIADFVDTSGQLPEKVGINQLAAGQTFTTAYHISFA